MGSICLPGVNAGGGQVRDWYVDSFRELRQFPEIKDGTAEQQFTSLLRGIYSRHRNVVPVMAMGVAELKKELSHGTHPAHSCKPLHLYSARVIVVQDHKFVTF